METRKGEDFTEQPAVRTTIFGGRASISLLRLSRGILSVLLLFMALVGVPTISIYIPISAFADCFTQCGYTLTDFPEPPPIMAEIEKADKGDICGYVIDNEGEPVSGVLVTLKYKGFEFLRTTDVDGFYKIEGIPIGVYEVSATRADYNPAIISGIEIKKGDFTRLDFELERPPDYEDPIFICPPLIEFKETGKGRIGKEND